MAEQITEQRFGPTSGQVTGWLGVGIFVLSAGYLALVDRGPRAVATAALLAAIALLLWCFLLRPRVLLRPGVLVLRNAFSDWSIPLATVTDVVVRQVTVVTAADEVYHGIGVGRPLRRLLREHPGRQPVEGKGSAGARPDGARGSLSNAQLPDFMVEQVLERAALTPTVPEQATVRRRYAVPELVGIGVLLAVFAVLTAL